MTTDTTWISLESDGFSGYELNNRGDVRTTSRELLIPMGSDNTYRLEPKGLVLSRAELLAGHFGNPEWNENFYDEY